MLQIDRKRILHVDDDILVLDKPAGLLSIRDGFDPELPYVSSLLTPIYGRLWLVHRLDMETSGVMILARNAVSHRHLNLQFQQHTIIKKYHCLVLPAPDWEQKELNESLLVNADRAHRTHVNPQKGKNALTHVTVLCRNSQLALVECEIFTGITHQIRAHLYHQGLGIIGDELYRPLPGKEERTKLASPRMLLHSRVLTFSHPARNELMTFTADYPSDFSAFLSRLSP